MGHERSDLVTRTLKVPAGLRPAVNALLPPSGSPHSLLCVSAGSGLLSFSTLLLLLLLLPLPAPWPGCGVLGSQPSAAVFRSPHLPHPFQHLAVDQRTGTVYLSAVNHLHRLTPDLRLQQTVVTGPQPDNPRCPGLFFPDCSHSKSDTDSFSKVLLVDDSNRKLVTCWSLFQGFCERRALSDVAVKETFAKPVVTNHPDLSTFAFISPGPTLHPSNTRPAVLYVGNSQGREMHVFEVPAFASRNLSNFNLRFSGNFRQSKITIEIQQRHSFPVQFVYGFGSENFSYMITTQRRDSRSDDYVSKMFSVCQNDPYFYSYVEMQLQCVHEGVDYNLAQAAYVHQAGGILGKHLGIPTEEDVLFAVFSKGNPQTARPTDRSAFCVYPMSLVRRQFTKAIKKCHRGLGNTGPDHITTPVQCLRSRLVENITDDYCGELEFNQPIAGSAPIVGSPVMAFSTTLLTAVAVASTDDQYTSIFLGTDNGTLIRVSMNSTGFAVVHEKLSISPKQRILKDLVFDKYQEHLYILTEHHVFRLRTHNCSRYTTVGQCVEARDPLCGWCSVQNRCTPVKMCPCRKSGWLTHDGADEECLHSLLTPPSNVTRPHMLTFHVSDVPGMENSVTNRCTYKSRTNMSTPLPPSSIFSAERVSTTSGIQCVTSAPPSPASALAGNETHSGNMANDSCVCVALDMDSLEQAKQRCGVHLADLGLQDLWAPAVTAPPPQRPEQPQTPPSGPRQGQQGQGRGQGGLTDHPCPAGLVTLDPQGLHCVASMPALMLQPVCVTKPMCAVDLSSPLVRAVSNRTKVFPGEIVTYKCVEGSERKPNQGTAERVCLVNGTLSGTEIVCELGTKSSDGGLPAILLTSLGILVAALLCVLAVLVFRFRRLKQSSTEAERNHRAEDEDEWERQGKNSNKRGGGTRPIRRLPSLPVPEDGHYSVVDSLPLVAQGDSVSQASPSPPAQTPPSASCATSSEAAADQDWVCTPEGYLVLLNVDDSRICRETAPGSRRDAGLGHPTGQQPVQAGRDEPRAELSARCSGEEAGQTLRQEPLPPVQDTCSQGPADTCSQGPPETEEAAPCPFPAFELASIFSPHSPELPDADYTDEDVQPAAQRPATYDRPTVCQTTAEHSRPYDSLLSSSDSQYDDYDRPTVCQTTAEHSQPYDSLLSSSDSLYDDCEEAVHFPPSDVCSDREETLV